MADQWETDEVINWLINDEGCYIACSGERATMIERFVRQGYAPPGLYDQLSKADLSRVDWDAVEDALA